MQENNKIGKEDLVQAIGDFVFEVAKFGKFQHQPYSAILLEVQLWLNDNKFWQNKLAAPSSTPQSVEGIFENNFDCYAISTKQDEQQGDEVMAMTKPTFVKAMTEYANQLVGDKEREIEKLKKEINYWQENQKEWLQDNSYLKARCEAAELLMSKDLIKSNTYNHWQSLKNKKPE